MPLPRIPKRSAARETAQLVSGQFNITTPIGMVLKQSPTGQQWQDDKLKPFPAEITGNGTSSSSDSTSSETFYDRYDWQELVPNANKVLAKKENGRSGTSEKRPAIEANGQEDVPIGSVVWLFPGTGEPDWYWFLFSADASSDHTFTFIVDCEGGTIIVGDGDPPVSSSKTGGTSSGGIVPKVDGNSPGLGNNDVNQGTGGAGAGA